MSVFNHRRVFSILHQNDLPKIITAVFSQGMLSISNFTIGIIMAKYCEKSEYGMYVILFSFIGILGGYQKGIINAPLMTLIHNKNEHEQKIYISSLSAGKNYLFLPPLLVLTLSMIVFGFISRVPGYYLKEGVVLFAVTTIFLSKEFLRVLNFVSMDTKTILIMDLLNVIVVFIGMFFLVYYDIVSSLTGIVILGVGYFVAYLFSRKKYIYKTSINKKSIKSALLENWNYGKWVFLGVTSSLLQERGYIYIVTALLGLSTLAEISASRLFLVPIGLLSLSSAQIVIAKGSKMVASNNNKEFRDFVFSFVSVSLGIWFIYYILILLISDYIVLFLGEKYANLQMLIAIWGIYFFIYTIRMLIGTALIVYGHFKKQAAYDIVGSTLAIASCFFLISIIGRSGGIISLIIGEAATMLLYLKLYIQARHA
jgi:O-antigen/teichoic acid export membrane protein